MADNTDILRPVSSDEDESIIIDTINYNFFTLAKRIKGLNDEFSYLDLMRIAKVFTSAESDPNTILNSFISTCWGSLDNYAGVYIRLYTARAYFKLDENTTIRSGDYVVKLPGNQFLHIAGMDPDEYVPQYDVQNPFQVHYVLATEETAYLGPINVPTVAATGIQIGYTTTPVAPNGALQTNDPIPRTLSNNDMRDVHWFVANTDEEVVWGGITDPDTHEVTRAPSCCSAINYTTIPLDARYIYYIAPSSN